MAKITYTGNGDKVAWLGVIFEKGKKVETDNEILIRLAEKNPFFIVEVERPKKVKESAQS